MNTQTEQEYPTRNALIAAIAMVALYGLEQSETDILCLSSQDFGTAVNIDKDLCILEIKRVHELINQGKPVVSSSRRIAECLAHARQMAHIRVEEWEAVIQFTFSTQKSGV